MQITCLRSEKGIIVNNYIEVFYTDNNLYDIIQIMALAVKCLRRDEILFPRFLKIVMFVVKVLF